MFVKLDKFPNLLMTKRVAETFSKDKSLTASASDKMQELLYQLNEFGANKEHLGAKGFKKFPKGWHELRIKDGTDTWRLLFKKFPKTKVYGLVYMFLKQTDAITTEQWKTAEHTASLENWI